MKFNYYFYGMTSKYMSSSKFYQRLLTSPFLIQSLSFLLLVAFPHHSSDVPRSSLARDPCTCSLCSLNIAILLPHQVTPFSGSQLKHLSFFCLHDQTSSPKFIYTLNKINLINLSSSYHLSWENFIFISMYVYTINYFLQ